VFIGEHFSLPLGYKGYLVFQPKWSSFKGDAKRELPQNTYGLLTGKCPLWLSYIGSNILKQMKTANACFGSCYPAVPLQTIFPVCWETELASELRGRSQGGFTV